MVALPEGLELGAQATDIDTAAVTRLATLASRTGYDVVDLAGFFDEVDGLAQNQMVSLRDARNGAQNIETANQGVIETVVSVTQAATETLEKVKASSASIEASLDTTKNMAAWVAGIEDRVAELDATLKSIVQSNGQITTIAKQVNILAINATIEAARAGDAGKGFAVVADAIKDLSRQTAQAAAGIGDNITNLGDWTTAMRVDAQTTAEQTAHLVDAADSTHAALRDITHSTERTHQDATNISARARDVEAATAAFAAPFKLIEASATTVGDGITKARGRLEGMVDSCEKIVQATTGLGAETPDSAFIAAGMDMAEQIADLFEHAIEVGTISQNDLFSQQLTPISNTAPQQHMAPFTDFTDQVLPPILEAALQIDARVAFCAAVTRSGYLPTHNKQFSHPQGNDPEWNAGNCRNRRVFDDRVGLKAGQNQDPFLLQVYRRDMGNGEFILMKDLAVPITVQGKHWGGLRMGYKL